MLLEAESVKQSLRTWAPAYDEAFTKCIPVCRHFGYLRIYNEVADLAVNFHDNRRPNKYWDFKDVKAFITTHKLKDENLYDICRGHDLLKLLSLTLVDVQTYSVDALMAKMTEAYSLDDFKTTKLYSSIKTWQATEGTPVIRYVF